MEIDKFIVDQISPLFFMFIFIYILHQISCQKSIKIHS